MKPPRIIVRPTAAPAPPEGAAPPRFPGDLLEGKITAIEGDEVHLALAGGATAILTTSDFPRFPTVGDRAQGLYLTDDQAGVALLTSRAPATQVDPASVRPGALVRGAVIEAGRPGVRVRIGEVTGYFPASQLPRTLLREPGALLRREMVGIVTEVRKGELLLSLRAVLDEREKRRSAQRIASFREGQRVTGTVARKTDFGYFIDLGGVDGLLHISRVEKHDEKRRAAGEEPLVFSPRQTIEVIVARVEADRGRIGLDLPEPAKPVLPAASTATATASGSTKGAERAAQPAAPAEVPEANGIIRELTPAGARVYISDRQEGWLPIARFGGASPRPGELRCFRVVSRDPGSGRLELSLELRGVLTDEES